MSAATLCLPVLYHQESRQTAGSPVSSTKGPHRRPGPPARGSIWITRAPPSARSLPAHWLRRSASSTTVSPSYTPLISVSLQDRWKDRWHSLTLVLGSFASPVCGHQRRLVFG